MIGCVVCVVSMVLAALGVVGTGVIAASSSMDMANMTVQNSSASSSLFGFLLQYGKSIFILSVILVTLSVGLKRKGATLLVLLGGIILYWGMYLQNSLYGMYFTVVIGFLIWGVTYTRYALQIRFK